jgi:SET domain-containing protein
MANMAQTGSRGFGLIAVEDIKEDDFVIDYRGEIIGMEWVTHGGSS